MKLSLNWIRDYIDLPETLDIAQLTHDLTMRTVEVEGAENPAELLDGIVVGEVLSVAPHPNADKLRIAMTDVGAVSAEPLQIVCGGSNLEPGQLVAVSVPGAMVRWHGEGEPVEIKPAELRGVMSYGMICGADELGLEDLFPTTQEAEIMDLRGFDTAAGEPLAEALDLADWILEIDNKSMTNRPDLWGHYGVARELAAIYGLELKALPEFETPVHAADYSVVIEAPEDCRRYIGAVYEGVENKPAPYWMQRRLWSVGQRPINQLVDITNYVMMATGQPTHGFDETHVHGGIIVRHARPGETLELLDRTDLTLTEEDLVICDERGPLALAGVMGGARDSILPETHRLVLEVANFRAQPIRRTATRYDHRTESSTRFEKAIDTQRVDQAMAEAHRLIRELMPDAQLIAYQDTYPVQTEGSEIEVKRSFLESRLGRSIDAEEIRALIEPLGFRVNPATKSLGTDAVAVEVPTWRSTGDVSLPDDILEEVARMIGYENFAFVAPQITLEGPVDQPVEMLDRSVREYLAGRGGFREIFTYPWIDDEYIEAAGLPLDGHLTLATPPAPTQSRLRASLVPGLLEAVAKNLRYRESFRVFEVTEVFRPGEVRPLHSPEVLPEQELHLGAALAMPESADPVELLRVARGLVEALPRYCQAESLSLRGVGQAVSSAPAWADKHGWLEILDAAGEVIGVVGIVSLKTMADADIRRARVALIELNMEQLTPLASRDNSYEALPHYPLVEEDLSLIMDEGVTWAALEAAVLKQDDVKRVRFMEEYRGSQIPAGKKSVMLRFWIGSDEGTLTSEAIEASTQRIVDQLKAETGAEVRQQ